MPFGSSSIGLLRVELVHVSWPLSVSLCNIRLDNSGHAFHLLDGLDHIRNDNGSEQAPVVNPSRLWRVPFIKEQKCTVEGLCRIRKKMQSLYVVGAPG